MKLKNACSTGLAKHLPIHPNVVDCWPFSWVRLDRVSDSCTDTGGLCPKLGLVIRAHRNSIEFTLFCSSSFDHICTKSVFSVPLHHYHEERTFCFEDKNKPFLQKPLRVSTSRSPPLIAILSTSELGLQIQAPHNDSTCKKIPTPFRSLSLATSFEDDSFMETTDNARCSSNGTHISYLACETINRSWTNCRAKLIDWRYCSTEPRKSCIERRVSLPS